MKTLSIDRKIDPSSVSPSSTFPRDGRRNPRAERDPTVTRGEDGVTDDLRPECRTSPELRITDGQIAEAHLYFDAATMLRQFRLPQTLVPGQPVPAGR